MSPSLNMRNFLSKKQYHIFHFEDFHSNINILDAEIILHNSSPDYGWYGSQIHVFGFFQSTPVLSFHMYTKTLFRVLCNSMMSQIGFQIFFWIVAIESFLILYLDRKRVTLHTLHLHCDNKKYMSYKKRWLRASNRRTLSWTVFCSIWWEI